MQNKQYLYLITLEVVPLVVGKAYNPLPSHLTLMSRFWSKLQPDELASVLKPLFDQTPPIQLVFGNSVQLGPKKTLVHVLEHTKKLKELHANLCKLLDTANVTYEYPQFTGDNHKPHVSKRKGDNFTLGHTQMAATAYLIEVEIKGEAHVRLVRAKCNLNG